MGKKSTENVSLEGVTCSFFTIVLYYAIERLFSTELPECAGYRQFVRNLNPCARDLKIAVCSDVRDLDNFAIK